MNRKAVLPILAAALAAAAAAALCIGPDGFSLPWGTEAEGLRESAVLCGIRLPRVLMAVSVGAVLALGGLVMQTVFRNPLAEPYLLGISGGASLGYTAALMCGLPFFAETAAAFAAGMATLAAVLACGAGRGRYGILLSGVMANAFCGAAMLALTSLLRPEQLVSVVFWSMGNLGSAGLHEAMLWGGCMAVPAVTLCFFPRMLDVMLLGDDAAASLGLRVPVARAAVLAAVSLMVSLSVAAAGPVGFVGLVVPQCLRLLWGGGHALLLPASMLAGALFLLVCDTLARSAGGGGELAVGAVTAVIGAPVFIALLRRRG